MADYTTHANNSAAMWCALAEGYGEVLTSTAQVRIMAPSPYHSVRAIVLDAGTAPEDTIREVCASVLPRAGTIRSVVEDASGTLDLTDHGFVPRFRMAVMARDPGAAPPPAASRPGTVAVVGDRKTLVIAERILIAVFPPARVDEDMRGRIQPAGVLDLKGWQVWLGRRSEVPAGTAYTYHDGASLGVYQVATLPEHRGHGVGRALMESILDAHPDVPVTLTATDQGRPLYERLGFHAVSEAVWWIPAPTGGTSGGDMGGPLR